MEKKEQKYQRTVGMKIMMARILRSIEQRERLGLYSQISKENLSDWMDVDAAGVDEMIALFRSFGREGMISHIIHVFENEKRPINPDFAAAAIEISGDEYCLHHILKNKEGMQKAAQAACEQFSNQYAALSQDNTSQGDAEKILLFYSGLLLSSIVRARDAEKEPEVIVEMLKGRYHMELVQTIQHILEEEWRG